MSPEVAVAAKWRDMFTDPYVKQHLVLVAVDEAHCIHEWLVSMVTGNNCVISARTYRGADFRKALNALVNCEHWWISHLWLSLLQLLPLLSQTLSKHFTLPLMLQCHVALIIPISSPVCTLSVSMLHVILMCVFLRRMFTCSGTYMAYLIC